MRWKPYATASKAIANVGLEGLMSLHDELESLPKFFIPTIDKKKRPRKTKGAFKT